FTHHGPWQLEAYNFPNMRWINERNVAGLAQSSSQVFSYTHHGPWQLEAYNFTNMRWINERKVSMSSAPCHEME
ncbi:hypothetical protein CAPTEDRAFT_90891, partial [Capitella teleta]